MKTKEDVFSHLNTNNISIQEYFSQLYSERQYNSLKDLCEIFIYDFDFERLAFQAFLKHDTEYEKLFESLDFIKKKLTKPLFEYYSDPSFEYYSKH